MNVLLPSLSPALAALLGLAQDGGEPAPSAPQPPVITTPELLEEQLRASDEAVVVTLLSKEGDAELIDVVSHGAPAADVLARIASTVKRELKLEPGEASFRVKRGIDVCLRRRPLRDALTWVTGAAGLTCELSRDQIRCAADAPDTLAPTDALTRAIDGWRAAILHDPDHPDTPRLRFEIANALFQLGDYAGAQAAYHDLERDAPSFGDLPFAYLRCGQAHAELGDENGAQAQWLSISQLFPRDPLVASARLKAVRSFRRQKDEKNAAVVLRLVVEEMKGGLSPADLVEASELLNEGGSPERAIEALHWALQSTSDPEIEERGLVQLARAQASRKDWSGVIETAGQYVQRHADGRRAAEMQWLLAQAHRELEDPFTALLALRRARELHPDDRLELQCDLLEGTLYAECGVLSRAEPCLSRAGASEFPEIAAPALATHARLLIDHGQFEPSRRLYERLATLPGHDTDAAVGLAEVSLLQHNYKLCLQEVNATLPHADAAQRARLLELADSALRSADPSVVLESFAAPLDAPPSEPSAPPARDESQR
jgi:tetratricopeptide (TPR) repeat protein